MGFQLNIESPICYKSGWLHMLIIFMIFLIIASIMVLIVKRNKETLYLFAMCISLALMLIGILIYIAKKGGISKELQNFFFFNLEIKTTLQYLFITLNELGYLIAAGRYLFPMFLLLLTIHYSMIPWLRRSRLLKGIVVFIPALTLLIYYPRVFLYIIDSVPSAHQLIINVTYFWIFTYLIAAVCLFVYEAYSIKMRIFQRQFFVIMTFIFSLIILYFLYCGQDPSQVYRFYANSVITTHGIYYLNTALSVPVYLLIVLSNIVVAVIGFTSLLKYTQEIFESSKQGEIIKEQSDAVNMGTSVFVHGIKNQLLANRVMYKRIGRLYEETELDKEKLKSYTDRLSEQNENILLRIDELYNTVKTNQVHLVPVKLTDIVAQAFVFFDNKQTSKIVEIKRETKTDAVVLADDSHLSEAIYNLIINAYDAVADDGGTVTVKCYSVRLYNVVEIVDNGVGMTKAEMKKILDPFYSDKNSNYNWGMGLYYVRTIVQEHYGVLKYESKKGVGSVFYILLPNYK